jgi:hypothetical protein
LSAYRAIIKFIPKFKDVLPYQANVDKEYIHKVIDAVRNAHILPCNDMTTDERYTDTRRLQFSPLRGG